MGPQIQLPPMEPHEIALSNCAYYQCALQIATRAQRCNACSIMQTQLLTLVQGDIFHDPIGWKAKQH